ncbi:MAG: hypothetical protein HY927_05100 [Elusimicrobia bacterium]|nr:hypothetical protein [Elusimicrobiota bacterium]
MIRVASHVLISAPKDRVSRYLRDLRHLPAYDKKFAEVSIGRHDVESADLSAFGAFLGFKWKGSFRVEFPKDGGFHCEVPFGRLGRMAASYCLRPVVGGTVLTHEEVFHTALFLRPLLLLGRSWLAQALEAELWVIKEGAERLDRQIKLKEIESLI